MLIYRIRNEPVLSKYIEDTCCENGVCVTISKEISTENYVIIKVDKFYNAKNISDRPASVDCLIVRKCIGGGYGLTLVELKSNHNSGKFSIENIKEKFETTINNFIKVEFKDYLDIHYEDIKLYFVSKYEVNKRDLGLKMNALMNLKFPFNSMKYMLRVEMPDPTIKNCYSK
jgi:hypothetical protein